MIQFVIGVLLAAGAVWFVLLPIFRPAAALATAAEDEDEGDPEDDMSPHAVALRALREIEFDRATGKLSDADYDALHRKYTAEALAALRAEQGEGEREGGAGRRDAASARPAPASDRSAAAPRPVAPPPTPGCPAHGKRPEPDAVFCSQCGRRLAQAPGYCSRCGGALEQEARYCHACGTRVAA